MPELPEVEVVRSGLAQHVLGHVIESVDVDHPRAIRRDPRGSAGFAGALLGQRVDAVRRRGKYFWLALASGDALLAHLGMSGQMLLKDPESAAEKHLRVRFGLVDTRGRRLDMRFVDQRTFGGLLVSTGGADLPSEIAHIARDPIDPDFDDEEFVRRARLRSSAIKRLLLDQGLISGVGNIYADESLWRAELHGERRGDQLSASVLHRLLGHVREVMGEALAQGGTSFDALYVNVNGESGYFDRSLDAYGQEDRPCPRCGTAIRRVPFMNRSSYFCPRCQRPPRGAGK